MHHLMIDPHTLYTNMHKVLHNLAPQLLLTLWLSCFLVGVCVWCVFFLFVFFSLLIFQVISSK